MHVSSHNHLDNHLDVRRTMAPIESRLRATRFCDVTPPYESHSNIASCTKVLKTNALYTFHSLTVFQ